MVFRFVGDKIKWCSRIPTRDKYSVKGQNDGSRNEKQNLLKSLNENFRNKFKRLGETVGTHPKYFLYGPILISLLFMTGFAKFQYVNDVLFLYSPLNGRGWVERQLVENYFPMNYSGQFNPSRVTGTGGIFRTIVTTKDGENLLRADVWREIQQLDTLIRNTSVPYSNKDPLNYESICSRWQEDCYTNDILELMDKIESIEAGNFRLTYPGMVNPDTFHSFLFPTLFGGIKVSNESTIESVEALSLYYFQNVGTPEFYKMSMHWERAIMSLMDNSDDKWEFIKVDRMSIDALATELDKHLYISLPVMFLTIPGMILFAIATMCSADWVRAKPWLGVVATMATVFGALGAYGLMFYAGVPAISIVMPGLFLAIGIGIDDSFVMLAAWRKTKVADPVPKRLGEAYAEAAVSITITSLTDMLSFCVGIATPFNCVRIFCIYTGAAVVGTYICHITMFGAAMALSGHHEADNRHGILFWRQIESKSSATQSKKSWFYRTFLTGGQNPSDPHNPLDQSEFGMMVFFRDYWAYYINKPIVKTFILLLFLVYIIIAGYGISQTVEGTNLGRSTVENSKGSQYFDTEDYYFREYSHRIQIILTGDVDYSNKTTQQRIERMLTEFEESEFVGENGAFLTESWLRSFLRYAQRLESVDLGLDLSNETSFIQSLQENYLGPSSIYTDDVKFNEDSTKIIASRFIIQTVNISDSHEETDMVIGLRELAAAQAPDLNVTTYTIYFLLFDQFLVIRPTTIQCVAITCIIMMVISLILIPNPLCSLWVAFSILSIETGVLGFLVLWNVHLDSVSMINLIMCIGFSVDFTAHISYAYITTDAETPEERVKECLYSLGMPIVQGAVSTMLGILALFTTPSYILTTFSKSVVLVMVIAAAHGLLLLPVLLSLFGPRKKGTEDKGKNGGVDLVGTYTKSQKVPY